MSKGLTCQWIDKATGQKTCTNEQKWGKATLCAEHMYKARQMKFNAIKNSQANREAEKEEKHASYAELWQRCLVAGQDAAELCIPSPMQIVGYAPVTEGACGWAWITLRPANSPFANWIKKNVDEKNHQAGYHGGLQIWVWQYGQSIERKSAHASAMAKVLKDAGLKVTAESRLD